MISILDQVNNLQDLAREALGSANLNNSQVSVQPFSRVQNTVDNGATSTNYYALSSEGNALTTAVGTPNSLFWGFFAIGAVFTAYTAGSLALLAYLGTYRIDGTIVEIPLPFGSGAAVVGAVSQNYSYVVPRPAMFSYLRITTIPTAGNWTLALSMSFQGYKFIGT